MSYEVVVQGTKVPVKSWTKGVAFDQNSQQQVRLLAEMPFVFKHIAIMPDVHLGIGATIGSVIPTKGAIIPASVGVDIGCLDKQTQYLTKTGWKYFDEYNGTDEVLQYDPVTDKASFTVPLAYIKKPTEFMYHMHHSKGLDHMVCNNHKILFYRGYSKIRGTRKYSIDIANQFVHEQRSVHKPSVGFLTVFHLDQENGIDLSDGQIRVQIAVSADGSLRDRGVCEIHLKKERKITRIKYLLDYAKIDFKLYRHKDGTVTYSFIPPLETKSLNWIFNCSRKQLQIVCREVSLWDGHIAPDGQETFSTSVKENADAVQYAFAASYGTRCGIFEVTYNNGWNPTYTVYTTKNVYVGLAPTDNHPIDEVKTEDGYSYCFTVPSGFLVVRRNDCIIITGNCGMLAAKTTLKAQDMPDNLAQLRNDLERSVPHGFDKRGKVGGWFEIPENVGKVWDSSLRERFEQLVDMVPHLAKSNSINHLGTLGSGNHFLEICLDEENNVWIMLHSGSRGIGNAIGTHFIKAAKEDMRKHFISLPDQNLAYLVDGSDNFDSYWFAVKWAQDFAYFNRQIMLENAISSLKHRIKPFDIMGEVVNCHHNYVDIEHHFGQDVYVTRKGAVRARKNDLCIIPGSMGAKSFIARGLGNEDSFTSCSHGAGRVMSRTEARKTLTLEDHTKDTDGVECKKDLSVIDESPKAYKNIDDVMNAQSDLVEILVTLKQILCVKG